MERKCVGEIACPVCSNGHLHGMLTSASPRRSALRPRHPKHLFEAPHAARFVCRGTRRWILDRIDISPHELAGFARVPRQVLTWRGAKPRRSEAVELQSSQCNVGFA